jgi:citrate lyase subunit beta/citryl-CoA lyase
MLFMPGNNPGMLQTAVDFGADSIILDLEDAVAITEKDAARVLVREALKTNDYSSVEVVVRINPLSTPFADKDIEVIARLKPDAILLPKAVPEDVRILDERLSKIEKEEGMEPGSIRVHCLVETTFGVETVYETLQTSSRIDAVLLGGEDLAVDLAVKRTYDSQELFYARTKLINTCKAMKIDVIDTPFTDTNDYEGLAADTEKVKGLGFNGKLAINPRQIDTIHEVYSPSEADINHAQRVMFAQDEAAKEGLGVFSLDGKMVDLPVINRAKHTLDVARMIGLIK